MVKKGDTLVEVTLAVGIFSMVIVAISSVMNAGSSASQAALETTLTREEIDTQAEALRFIHSAYVAENSTDDVNASTPLAQVWKQIRTKAKKTAENESEAVTFQPSSCAELYDTSNGISKQNAFVINTKKLDSEDPSDILIEASDGKFFQPSTYPRLVYADASGALVAQGSNSELQRVEGLYVVAIRDFGTTSTPNKSSQVSAFIDFYIRSCWYEAGASAPSTISTVVRLYDPPDDVESYVDPYLTMTFYPNGGNGSQVSTDAQNGQSITIPGANDNRFGFSTDEQNNFLGWNTKSDGSGISYNAGQSYPVSGLTGHRTVRLYAQWRDYKIKYDANGGTGAPGVTTCRDKTACNISTTKPTRANYSFAGWATSSTATSAKYSPGDSIKSEEFTSSTSATLYAVWKTYTIKYDSKNGTAIPNTVCPVAASCKVSSTEPTRSGYTFKGWSVTSDATVATYQAGAKITPVKATTTLYAVWERYTIKYDANGGTGAPNTTYCATKDNCKLASGSPSRSGYTFLGWSTSSTATSASYSPGDSFTPNSLTTTLYAVWEHYAISYDANGGSYAPDTTYCLTKNDCKLASGSPSRSGYTFLGWSTSSTATSASYNPGDSFTPNSLTTNLYAVWRERNEAITIRADWTSSSDYDSHMQLQKPDGAYVAATYSTTNIPVTYNGQTYSLVTGNGDGRGSYNHIYYEYYTINTLGGKNYYYSIRKFSSGNVGNDITITVNGPYLGTKTFKSKNRPSSNDCNYWNVFAYKDGQVVERNTCSSSMEYGY